MHVYYTPARIETHDSRKERKNPKGTSAKMKGTLTRTSNSPNWKGSTSAQGKRQRPIARQKYNEEMDREVKESEESMLNKDPMTMGKKNDMSTSDECDGSV